MKGALNSVIFIKICYQISMLCYQSQNTKTKIPTVLNSASHKESEIKLLGELFSLMVKGLNHAEKISYLLYIRI